MVKQKNNHMLSIYEFIRHYYQTQGWYLADSDRHYTFRKLIFCATMNYRHPLPISLTKYISLVNRPMEKLDLNTIVKETVTDLLG